MTRPTATPRCPHCGLALSPFQLPENSGWDEQIHFACFNDECDYFRRGWVWMFDHYGVKASYRYRIDPVSGTESPLPVWSKDAIKDRILDADVIAEARPSADVSSEKSGNRKPETGNRAPTHPKQKPRKASPPRKGENS
jgi:hypothetical protein